MGAEPPDGWTTKRVDQIARVVGGSTPSSETKRFWDGAIPFVTPTDLTALEGRYLSSTERSINEEGRRAAGLEVLPQGSVLLATRASIGLAALSAVPVTTNQGFQNLVPLDGTDSLWLYYAISHRQPELARLAAGTTFRELSRKSLQALGLLVPPLSEQRAIAAVLDAIDDAIERTEAVIAATERLRNALLHELLTRGVPGWHSEWKQVPGLGTVPACWDVVRLGTVASEIRYGTSAKCDGAEQGIPVLRIPNVAQGRLDLTDLKYAQLPKRELSSLRLKDGDLLLVRTNGNPEICGRVALVEGLDGDWAYASYLVRLRTTEPLLPDYLWLYLNEESGRRSLSRHIRTSAGNFNLSVGGVRTIEIPLPSTNEQGRIADYVRAVRAREDCELTQLVGLRNLKARTADTLLSGRMRVPVAAETSRG